MKNKKHLETFKQYRKLNEKNDDKFDDENYDTVFSMDVAFMVQFLLGDLELYCDENNIILNNTQIQKIIDNFKENFNPRIDPHYSDSDHYESLSRDRDSTFFEEIINQVK